MTRPHRKFVSHAVLALTLLIAQLAAQAHAYSHLRLAPESAGTPVTQSAVCGECLLGGPLLAAASAPVNTFFIHHGGPQESPCLVTAPRLEQIGHSAFRARAPPRLV